MDNGFGNVPYQPNNNNILPSDRTALVAAKVATTEEGASLPPPALPPTYAVKENTLETEEIGPIAEDNLEEEARRPLPTTEDVLEEKKTPVPAALETNQVAPADDAAPAAAPAPAPAASKEEQERLKSDIAVSIASAILNCMQNTFNDNSIYRDVRKSDYIQRKVKENLSTIPIPITENHAKEIFKLIAKMKITLAQNKIVRGKVEYTFTFELHDSKRYFDSDSSNDRCKGIRIFINLINNLKENLIKGHTESKLLFERINGISNVNSIDVSAKIKYGGLSLEDSIKLCRNKRNYVGGSKSRRKPARKTRRGRTRKSKSKSKPKTHRRRRHSRVRKNKKYTSRK